MKRYLFALSVLGTLAFISSCQKDEDEKEKLDAQTQQFNDDANNYKGESDQADNDINESLKDIPGFNKTSTGTSIASSPLCGVTIDDTTEIANKIVSFHFDGITPCFSPSRTREGVIKVQLTSGNSWADAGSVLTITYINFKIVRLSDNKSIMFNGVKTLKNINGNDWIGFLVGSNTLKYQERALGIAVVYDNGQTATWNSARVTEWSYNPASVNHEIVFTANGDSIVNGFVHGDSWGVNRYGQNFTTNYTSPWVSNTYCGLWRPNSGQLVHHLDNNDFTLTLGVDQSGNATTLTCAYGFKVGWTAANGNTGSLVFSY